MRLTTRTIGHFRHFMTRKLIEAVDNGEENLLQCTGEYPVPEEVEVDWTQGTRNQIAPGRVTEEQNLQDMEAGVDPRLIPCLMSKFLDTLSHLHLLFPTVWRTLSWRF